MHIYTEFQVLFDYSFLVILTVFNQNSTKTAYFDFLSLLKAFKNKNFLSLFKAFKNKNFWIVKNSP